jgi:hypothetical protein
MDCGGKALTISVASVRFVLAMKLAARREKDMPGILYLLKETGLIEKDGIITAVARYFNADLSIGAWQRIQMEEFLDLIFEERRL